MSNFPWTLMRMSFVLQLCKKSLLPCELDLRYVLVKCNHLFPYEVSVYFSQEFEDAQLETALKEKDKKKMDTKTPVNTAPYWFEDGNLYVSLF